MSDEYVSIELLFEDGKEEIQLDKDIFLNIQMLALQDNVSFESKFIELLKNEIEKMGNEYE